MLRLLHVQNGHAVDRGALGSVGSRVRDVVCADHNGGVAVREAGVDLLHLMQLLIRHVGLGQKHVHVTGHTARDRVDGEFHVDAVGLEGVGQLLDLMLRLSQRHAVAGDDDDLLRACENLAGTVFGGLVRCGGLGILRSGVGRTELVHGLLRVAAQIDPPAQVVSLGVPDPAVVVPAAFRVQVAEHWIERQLE